MKKNCLLCGKEFLKPVSNSLKYWEKRNCCSLKCGNKAKIGKYPSWNKGKLSPETSGENNPAWTGTDDKFWRYQCKIRDDHTCQSCGLREPEIMEVDHIKLKSKFPELRYKLENLQTLCPNCHKRKTIKEMKLPRKNLSTMSPLCPHIGDRVETEDDIIKNI